MSRRSQHLSAAALSVALLGGCGAGEEAEFASADSPDGLYTLRVTVAEPRLGQGKSYVRAYIVPSGDGSPERILDTRLENDGVPFTSRNIAVRWTAQRAALICLRATDWPDRGLRVELGPPPRAIEVDRC